MHNFCNSPLWDSNLTWYTSSPFFTPCFEDVVLAPLPVVFLFTFSFLDLITCANSTEPKKLTFRTLTFLTTLKVFVHLSLIGIYGLQLVKAGLTEHVEWIQILSPLVQATGYIGLLALFSITHRSNVNNSGVQFGFWFLEVLTQGILFRTALTKINGAKNVPFLIPRLLTFPIITFRFVLEWFNQDSFGGKFKSTKTGLPNPDKTSPFLSKILFSWYDSLAWAGYRKTLTSDDLWDLNSKDTSSIQYTTFAQQWTKGNKGSLGSVLIPILKSHGLRYGWALLLKVAASSLLLMQPFIVTSFIAHVSTNEEPAWKGYLYMTIITIAALLQTTVMATSDKMVQVIGMRVKAALSNAIFRKSLRISHAAKTKDSSVGEMMNLISLDVQKFMDFIHVHHASPALVLIIVMAYILQGTLGVSAFAGLGTLCGLFIISNLLTIFVGTKYQNEGMKLMDERIRITSELLGGIKVLKFYGWEIPFEKKIQEIRKRELNCVWKVSWILSLVTTIFTTSPIMVAMVTFSCFLLFNPQNLLTPTIVFVLINVMNILRGPMVLIPTAVIHLSQIYVSINRLNKFFQLEELEGDCGESVQKLPPCVTGGCPVIIDHGSFSWGPKEKTLHNVSLRVEEGELVAVVGRIAAGKSSLIAAILGEMKTNVGSIHVATDSIAYVAQTPWIQNATLRDNVLFGSAFDAGKYGSVIRACALEPDLLLLPAGDQTEIGENATNLSGGQKQRVALARAAYREASLYLFDDPLSAVDSRVGRHIFDSLLGPDGILKWKTRILVTHNTRVLPYVDRILVMKEGHLIESGTYDELLHAQGEFSDFLQSVAETGKESNGIEEPMEGESDKQEPKMEKSEQMMNSGKLVAEEKSAVGNITFRCYYDYFTSAGVPVLLLGILFFVLCEGLWGFNNVFLSQWSTKSEDQRGMRNSTAVNRKLVHFVLLGCGQWIATLLAYLALTVVCIIGTKEMHARALGRILRSPMSYFDRTLRGSLLSRFARDVEVTDFQLLQLLRLLSPLGLGVLVTVIIISITTPPFLFALIPITVIYVLLQRFYVATSRQLKRIESVSRSPIYSHFSETLGGLSTIRAFKMEPSFITEIEKRIDENQKCSYAFVISNLWVMLRLELIGAAIVFFTCLFVLLGRETIDGGQAGLAVTYALGIKIHLNLLARLTSDLENNLVSVERLSELMMTPQENPWAIPATKPSDKWPLKGELIFEGYGTRYRAALDLVLKGITLKIGSEEKIGVVGRTGAGKSSLALALFRIIEASEGRILIDGIDIATIGLQELRRRITIIPQDPILFSGSLRTNLDPFEEHTDEELWHSLELSHLKTKIDSSETGLEFRVDEDGKNFSVGERQLICLARALLRQSRILVLDEATAAVDVETDDLIQETVRREFSTSTVVTIAHRLHTIMDSDRVLVLRDGEVAEFDSPRNLLNDSSSHFFQMAQDGNLIKKFLNKEKW